jgi:alpha-1,3-rhamnosyl/mannosyltransferase
LDTVDRIVCISQFTADEAMNLLQIPASKMEVVHNGCDFHPTERPKAELTDVIPNCDEFFLFVGSLEPGKNLKLLQETYRLAREKKKHLAPLFVMGARWAGVGREARPPVDWHYLGHQPDSVLVALYQGAIALVFPTKYEGFGLPVAEAMAVGCPVICSAVASLPEVGGDAVRYADQTPEAYLEAMLYLQSQPASRAEMIQRGQQQAQKFSWERCAKETAQVYHHALGI